MLNREQRRDLLLRVDQTCFLVVLSLFKNEENNGPDNGAKKGGGRGENKRGNAEWEREEKRELD